MSDKLRGTTTIVTEARTFLVDSVSKKAVARAAVSARSPTIETRDVEVTQTQGYTIARHANKHLTISTTFPVIATFIPGTPEDGNTELPPETSYTTGIVYADPTVDVNGTLELAVWDPDVSAPSVRVTVFNMTTGETEYVTLKRADNGMYRGSIRVELKRTRGDDFDAIMNASAGDKLRVIYQDGRGTSGEPETVTQEVAVTSSFVHPKLICRRNTPIAGILGVALLNAQQYAPIVMLTNMRSGESSIVTLNRPADSVVDQAQLQLATLVGLEVDDIVAVEYRYSDEYGTSISLRTQTVIVDALDETDGRLLAPAVIHPALMIDVGLDDPDMAVEYVDLVLSGDASNKFVRIRCTQLAPYTGIYQGQYMLEQRFDNDQMLTLTYADSSNAAPKLIRQQILVERLPAAAIAATALVLTQEVAVQQMALQMEINGLFILNGQFSGIIKLKAKENETVRCSIVQAS